MVPTLQDADAVSRPKKTLQTSATCGWGNRGNCGLFQRLIIWPINLLGVLQNIVEVSAWNFGEGSLFYIFLLFFRWLVQPVTSLSSYMESPKLSWNFRTEKIQSVPDSLCQMVISGVGLFSKSAGNFNQRILCTHNSDLLFVSRGVEKILGMVDFTGFFNQNPLLLTNQCKAVLLKNGALEVRNVWIKQI